MEEPRDVPVRKNHLARDISDLVTKAASALRTGQLIKDESFTLFDSVQALELMDPKMDAGYLEEGETLDSNYDVSRNLMPEEILWIMDHLLCYQMAWHQGYALSQNVFSSLYIDNLLSATREAGQLPTFLDADTGAGPNEMTQLVLGAFCVSIIKSIDIAAEIVASQHYYEEEDFNTQTFDRDLLTDLNDHDYFAMVQDAYTWLEEQWERGKVSEVVVKALQARLLMNVRLIDSIYPVPDDLPSLAANIDFRRDVLQCVKRTHRLGRPVDDSFSIKLQRKLASTTPPRPLNILDFDEACSIMGKIREDLLEAYSLNYVDDDADMQRIEAFLWAFADREPLALPRAAVQIHLFSEGKRAAPGSGVPGSNGIEDIMWSELQGYMPSEHYLTLSIFNAEAPRDEGFRAAAAVALWFKKGQDVFIDVLKSLCQNPCRVRRCLVNMLAEISQLIQLIEDEFSNDIYKAQEGGDFTFSGYIKVMICEVTRLLHLRCVGSVVALGFRQDLYRDSELSDLNTRHANNLESISNRTQMILRTHNAYPKPPEPRSPLWNDSVDQESDLRVLPYRAAVIKAACVATRAVADLYESLQRLGAIPASLASADSELLQDDLRMQCFLSPATSSKTRPLTLVTSSPSALDTPATFATLLDSAISSKASLQALSIFDFQKDAAKFEQYWVNARLTTTEAADQYWRAQLRPMCQTVIAVGLHASTLKKGLQIYGSEEAMLGMVRMVMPEKRDGAFVLPKKVEVL